MHSKIDSQSDVCSHFFFFLFCRENRYLLFLTENYAALDILKYYLNRSRSKDLTSQPYILFGSSFPKDREYTQVGSVMYKLDRFFYD